MHEHVTADEYATPAIVHEGELEVQAGSPLGSPDEWEELEEWDAMKENDSNDW
jgi:hypothetical protein